jgi:hypothetical protein
MFCFHRYGKIENGYQYCSKCGIAKAIPCSHTWKLTNEIVVTGGWSETIPLGYIYVYHCNRCGEVKQEKIK